MKWKISQINFSAERIKERREQVNSGELQVKKEKK